MYNGTVGDDTDLIAPSHHSCFAEGNREIRARIFRPIVGLAIEMLVLEKHHWIVRADGRAQQSADVQGARGHHHAQPRAMREDRLATLAVIHGAACKVTSDRNTHHNRSLEGAIGAPA